MASEHLYVPRAREDDEVSLISMRELAPSPIEDDDAFYASGPPTPTLSKSSTFGSVVSTTTTRGPGFWLARTQKYSSYAFLSFLGVHAATTAVSPLLLGVDSANATLLLARTYFYQSSPWVELALIPGSLALHVASGVGLRVYRHFSQKERYGGSIPPALSMWRWRNISGVSRAGWVAAPGVVAHAALMRLVPLWVDGDSSQVGLEYFAYGFWMGKWGKWVGAAFYGVFIGSMSYHVVYGLAKYWNVPEKRRRKLLGAAALASAVVWLAGMGRVVLEAEKVGGYLGRHYEGLYRTFFGGLKGI
jgi:hypothetical protein